MKECSKSLELITLTPYYDDRTGRSYWRVDLRYSAVPSEPEQAEVVSLSVLVEPGDRNVVAIQQEAIARAVKILQSAIPENHPDD